MNIEKINIQNAIGVAILAIVAYLLFLKPLLKRVTGEEDGETSDIKAIAKGSTSKSGVTKAFDTSFFAKVAKDKGKKPTVMLKAYGYKAEKLMQLANALYDAKGLVNDDETLVFNVLSSLPNLFVASALAFTFKQTYKRDMQSYLQSFLNESEYKQVVKILNRKKPL